MSPLYEEVRKYIESLNYGFIDCGIYTQFDTSDFGMQIGGLRNSQDVVINAVNATNGDHWQGATFSSFENAKCCVDSLHQLLTALEVKTIDVSATPVK